MGNRIKGITVEIGGDTTGLDKTLKGVNSTILTTQSSLRDVSRLLKLNAKNVELLSKKQKLLSTIIKGIKEIARKIQIQGDHEVRYDSLVNRFNAAKTRFEEVSTEILAKNCRIIYKELRKTGISSRF